MSLTLNILTPDHLAFSGIAESVTIPTTVGEVTILSGHMPLISELSVGTIQILNEGYIQLIAVKLGFLQIGNDCVTILTNTLEVAHSEI